MWKLFFILIVTVAATEDDFDETPECRSIIYRECEDMNVEPDFPGSEEELEEFCKFALNYFECSKKYLEQCDERKENEVEYAQMLRELTATFNRICDKESLLYSALGANLHCLKENQRELNHCPGIQEATILENFSEVLSSSGITDVAATDSDDPDRCLRVLYGVGCFASNAGNVCGDVARDVVVDIVQGFDLPFQKCRPGVKENLSIIVRAMQLEATKNNEMENLIKKKK